VTMSNKRRKRKRQANKTVTVYLDGEVVVVPTVVDCHFAARGALGIPRGMGVICRSRDDEPLAFRHGHTFHEGEFYETVSMLKAPMSDPEVKDEEPEDNDGLDFTRDPDFWKR
jgi:hypothetical protein